MWGSVDPGVRYLAVAVWHAYRLVGVHRPATAAKRPTGRPEELARQLSELAPGLAYVVGEVPQDYAGRAAPAEHLAHMRDNLAAIRPRVWTVTPRAWKANVPKDVHHARVEGLLIAEELVVWRTCDIDQRDAVALGLWACGRAGRGGTRVPPAP